MRAPPLLIGNWKLNHSKASAQDFFEQVAPALVSLKQVDVAVAPVALWLDFAVQKLAGTNIAVAAQNVFFEEKGAFTGEWSARQLKELGVKMAIVGHSERRNIFKESDQDVAKKASACVKAGIIPVVCVGESLSERDGGKLAQVLERQCAAVMNELRDQEHPLIFAYEPVWAIGTGRSASAAQANEAHEIIRQLVSLPIKIIYGGSVTPQNIREIVSMPHVDGALVGGASLQVDSFLSMVKELTLGA
jgi:triosephosphate isomerase